LGRGVVLKQHDSADEELLNESSLLAPDEISEGEKTDAVEGQDDPDGKVPPVDADASWDLGDHEKEESGTFDAFWREQYEAYQPYYENMICSSSGADCIYSGIKIEVKDKKASLVYTGGELLDPPQPNPLGVVRYDHVRVIRISMGQRLPTIEEIGLETNEVLFASALERTESSKNFLLLIGRPDDGKQNDAADADHHGTDEPEGNGPRRGHKHEGAFCELDRELIDRVNSSDFDGLDFDGDGSLTEADLEDFKYLASYHPDLLNLLTPEARRKLDLAHYSSDRDALNAQLKSHPGMPLGIHLFFVDRPNMWLPDGPVYSHL
jgi:hypothetical protein